MITLMLLLALAAFVSCIASVMSRCPLWVPVFLLTVIELLRVIPLGK